MPQSNGRPASGDGLVSHDAAHDADRRSRTAAVRRRLVLACYFSKIGGRLAMVAAAPLFGAATIGLVLQQDPAAVVRHARVVGVRAIPGAARRNRARARRRRDGRLGRTARGAGTRRVVAALAGQRVATCHVGTMCALCAAQAPESCSRSSALALVALASTRSLQRRQRASGRPVARGHGAARDAVAAAMGDDGRCALAAIALSFSGGWSRLALRDGAGAVSAACSAADQARLRARRVRPPAQLAADSRTDRRCAPWDGGRSSPTPGPSR